MQKETYNRLLDKRTDEIQEIQAKKKLIITSYHFEVPHITPINFIKHKGPFHSFKEIREIKYYKK